MKKYCKILNEETGLVQVGAGCPDEYYIEIGMKKRDVRESDIDGEWYLADKCPIKPEPTEEEIKQAKIAELKAKLDKIDVQKVRPTSAIALNIATDEDIERLKELDAQAQEIRKQIQELL